METKKIVPRSGRRKSYTAKLMRLGVGEEANFRLIGSAYTNFYTAKWRLERSNTAHFEMSKSDERTLRVIRIS